MNCYQLLCQLASLSMAASAALQGMPFGPHLVVDDPVCNPSGVNFHYSGIRLYQAILYDIPVRHFWYLVRCGSGAVISGQYFLTNRSTNFQFGQPVCINYDDCFVLARRKKYAERTIPVFKPLAKVGMLYKVNSTANITAPLSTLTADNMALSVTVTIGLGRHMKLVPILFTSSLDFLPGTWISYTEPTDSDTNPFESYEYSEEDRHEPWNYINMLLNKLGMASTLGDKIAFWEFDALQAQLNGVDWRKIANKAVPDV